MAAYAVASRQRYWTAFDEPLERSPDSRNLAAYLVAHGAGIRGDIVEKRLFGHWHETVQGLSETVSPSTYIGICGLIKMSGHASAASLQPWQVAADTVFQVAYVRSSSAYGLSAATAWSAGVVRVVPSLSWVIRVTQCSWPRLEREAGREGPAGLITRSPNHRQHRRYAVIQRCR